MRNSTGASRRGDRTPACCTYDHLLPTKAGNEIQPRTEYGVVWFREHSVPVPPLLGRARIRHKLPSGSFHPLTQSTPKKPAFYPALISEDEKLCFGQSAEMLRAG